MVSPNTDGCPPTALQRNRFRCPRPRLLLVVVVHLVLLLTAARDLEYVCVLYCFKSGTRRKPANFEAPPTHDFYEPATKRRRPRKLYCCTFLRLLATSDPGHPGGLSSLARPRLSVAKPKDPWNAAWARRKKKAANRIQTWEVKYGCLGNEGIQRKSGGSSRLFFNLSPF